MLPSMIEVREYVPEERTASHFAEWFFALNSRRRQFVDDAMARMRLGNFAERVECLFEPEGISRPGES